MIYYYYYIYNLKHFEYLCKKYKPSCVILVHVLGHPNNMQRIKSISKKAFKAADSQVASRWGNILDFKGFDLITPTEQEARYSLFEQDLTIRTLATKLMKNSKSKNIILKIGERGLIALANNKPEYITLDPFVEYLKDANGAGDALLAYSSATLFKEKSLIMASIIGIIAASCKCEKKGNTPLKISEIISKINKIKNNMI